MTALPSLESVAAMPVHRRAVLGAAGAGVLGAGACGAARAAAPTLGAARPFAFADVIAEARRLAQPPYKAPPASDPALDLIDFDAYGQIAYDPARTIWGGADAAVRLFPQGGLFKTPVSIALVEGGVARSITYSPDLFRTPPNHPFRRLKDGAGFAGFRVMNAGGEGGDWLAFLGAAYFRTAGALNQYGASARGLALNAGGPATEEFPRFTRFWLERAPGAGLIVYALMEGPSVAGAYRFDNRKTSQGVVQTVEARLFFRKAVETLGVAPITSMFWYGENSPAARRDWRPEIHDSDGLEMLTGSGERIWRPLNNPPRVITNAFQDKDPKGFGLLQRDRDFDHYQDDGAFYDRRPSVWVEPLSPFGPGSVRLVEIPADRETDDNIVAFWTPERPVAAGDVLALAYRLSWTAADPLGGPRAHVIATREGDGGRPGLPPKPGYRKIAIDFAGEALLGLTRESGVVAAVSASGPARIEGATAYPVVGTGHWRIVFDVGGFGPGPVDLRAFLRRGNDALSETWLYQLFPGR
jgi:glucans biosynthesis protein